MARTRAESWDEAEAILGKCGRLLHQSKVTYTRQHPNSNPVFNANVCIAAGKVWFGDIDVGLKDDADKLKRLAKVLGQRVYVLREHDGRFDNEAKPLLDKAVYTVEHA